MRVCLQAGGDPVLLIGNARQVINPVADGIAPHNCLARLVLESRQDIAVELIVDVSLQSFPLHNEITGTVGSLVV